MNLKKVEKLQKVDLKDVGFECPNCYIPCKYKVSYDNRHIFRCPSCRQSFAVLGEVVSDEHK